jgi:hypothetical protein
LRYLRDIFNDWLTRSAGIIFILIVALIIFNSFSDLRESHPLFGVFDFLMVPILFIAGGVVFVHAVLRFSR